MAQSLLNSFLRFLKWVFLEFPARLFEISKRLVVLAFNAISLGLNFKLFITFTPLYGDYTKVGRLMGFVIRFFQVTFGVAFVILFSIFSLMLPFWWFVIPAVLFKFSHYTLPFYTLILAVLYLLSTRNSAEKRVSFVKDEKILKAFRPRTKKLFIQSEKNSKVPHELLVDKDATNFFKRLELLNNEFMTKFSGLGINPEGIKKLAFEYALKQGSKFVEIEHLILGIIFATSKPEIFLASFGSSREDMENCCTWLTAERSRLEKAHFWQEDYELPPMGGIGRGLTGRVTPQLDRVSEDFTKKAKKGLFRKVTAHQEKIREIANLLESSKSNVLLVGPPGSGKTSVVKGIAQMIIQGTQYKSLKFKRIVGLNTADLIAGTSAQGEIAQKFKNIMDEAKASGDIIIFFDDIHSLISGAGEADDASSVFSVLQSHIAESEIQFIGATDLESYRKHMEPNGTFARLFEVVEIPPTTDAETLQILKDLAWQLERQYSVFITYPALIDDIKLSSKLIHERVFPDKAVSILERVCTKVAKTTKMVDAEEIKAEISDETHVPVTAIDQKESEKLKNIGKLLKERVIGQDQAIDQIAKALVRARMGVRNENKPIASFLFIGTTGVGKTETAKALAEQYFGNEKAMIRLDMSEYQQQDSINRLLGDPNGLNKGVLTEAVRTNPFTLVLLDEIEKANAHILLTFLQVLDDGRLTDSLGVTADFTNALIIATSNVGTKAIQDVVSRGGSLDEMADTAMREVRNSFAPEFLNRFDDIITFKPLDTETAKKIVDIKLAEIRKIADEKSFKLTFKPELITELAKRGYSKDWGAREINRVISDTVEFYLAYKLLHNEIKMGDEIALGTEVFAELPQNSQNAPHSTV